MSSLTSSESVTRSYWFVGANWSTGDQTSRFLSEGIWEDGSHSKHAGQIQSMRSGDRIAIKAAYTRKHDLPFDNRNQTVAVMSIKAIGTIAENFNDGRKVRVDWEKVDPIREWYFFVYQPRVWQVSPQDWKTAGLIDFAFNGVKQDIERFRNAPFWRERFGSAETDSKRFSWIPFYEALAEKLLAYRHNRRGLVEGLRQIAQSHDGLKHLTEDHYPDGKKGFVRDICPFTTMGLFNRQLRNENRVAIAQAVATFLGVTEAPPDEFDGVPLLNNQNSWFFGWEVERPAGQIDALWDVFAAGLKLSESKDEDDRTAFQAVFDKAIALHGVGWNLTFGLYWARPWTFLSLDNHSQRYITDQLKLTIGRNGPKRRCSGTDYLSLMDTLESRFQDETFPVHTYPELSLEAWRRRSLPEPEECESTGEPPVGGNESQRPTPPLEPYGVANIVEEGCFLGAEELDRLLERLISKKNLILQGPPGTGKTWLARKLAFALMGQMDSSRVRAVQFHPNLSYEDFVRGWRPLGDGRLSIAEGVFMEAVNAALGDSSPHVLVIEEINRGNPAQVFGEMLTLLEAGKRIPSEALELSYPDADGTRRPVHIPDNLYIIGTMNIADRSLAMVDLALRRRFAFVTLEPRFGPAWRDWVVHQLNVEASLAEDIERRITELNRTIHDDPRLGKPFCIGHSYVTPVSRLEDGMTRAWFRDVVETEIGPLLEEYWFDAPDTARQSSGRLLRGW